LSGGVRLQLRDRRPEQCTLQLVDIGIFKPEARVAEAAENEGGKVRHETHLHTGVTDCWDRDRAAALARGVKRVDRLSIGIARLTHTVFDIW